MNHIGEDHATASRDVFSFKECSACHLVMPSGDFYYNSRDDSYSGRCKQCIGSINRERKEERREYYQENIERYRERYQKSKEKIVEDNREKEGRGYSKRFKSESARARYNEAQRRYKERNKDRVKAQYAVRRAIKSGILPELRLQQCSRCGEPATVYHHWSYKPEWRIDVVPLCNTCHGWIHSHENEGGTRQA